MAYYLKCVKCSKTLRFIIYATFFGFLTNFIFGHVYNDNMDIFKLIDTDNQKKLSFHIIYHYIFRFLGIFVIALIFNKRERNNIKKKSEEYSLNESRTESSAIILIYENMEDEINTNNISPLNVYIVITIMVLQRILEDIYYKSSLRGLDLWMFELPLVSYLNKKILHFKIYRHHYFAIYINIIFGLLYKISLLIINMISLDTNEDDDKYIYYKYKKNKWLIPVGIIFYLLYMIPRAYAISKIKVFMDLKYISPYKLLIFYGFTGALISTIIGTISTFLKCPKDYNMKICNISNDNDKFIENYKLYWDIQNNFKDIIFEIIIIFFGIITNFFFEFFYILIIKYLTPMHIIFLNIIYSTLLLISGTIYNNIRNKNKSESNQIKTQKDLMNYIGMIILLISFFGLFVYLEIIVLNFCKLNYNLRENIIQRSIKEYENNKIGQININKENNGDDENDEEEY